MLPIVHQVFGSILVVAGLILLPLPIPFGLILLTIGFALLAPYIPAVQRLIRLMRGKWPSLDRNLRRYRDRFPPVIKKTIDKTHPFTSPAE
ncbi:MAG: PGPGW domain-containing protein [Pseudomonadota bacterium]